VPNGEQFDFNVGLEWSPNGEHLVISVGYSESAGYWLVKAAFGTILQYIEPLFDDQAGRAYDSDYAWTSGGLFIHTAWNSVCLGGTCTWNGALIEKVWPADAFTLRMRAGFIDDRRLPEDAYMFEGYGIGDSTYNLSPNGMWLLQNGTVLENKRDSLKLSLISGVTLWQLPLDAESFATQRYTLPTRTNTIIWSRDSARFILGSDVIDVTTGNTLTTLPSRRWGSAFHWSADSTRIAEVSVGVLYIWGTD
jgi:hypothetical protein